MQTITGKIIKFLPKVEGESAKGSWVRAGFVLEYGDEYPTKAAFTVFGETRLQQFAGLKEGSMVTVNFNPQSREYNDRWYTDLQCVSVFPAQQQAQPPVQQQTAPAQYAYAQQAPAQQTPSSVTMPKDDGLPF